MGDKGKKVFKKIVEGKDKAKYLKELSNLAEKEEVIPDIMNFYHEKKQVEICVEMLRAIGTLSVKKPLLEITTNSEYEVIVALEKQLGIPIPAINDLENKPLETFGFIISNNHIIKLGLYDKKLASVPDNIDHLKSLQFLSLAKNNIISLPESIGNLNSIQILSMAFNKINTLPKSLGNLKTLLLLDLRNNPLPTLPESLGNLTMLQEIYLDSIPITSIPDCFRNLKSLKILEICQTKISSLPENIGDLKSLQRLVLQNTPLSTIPDSIGKLSSLKQLILNFNSLSSLPDCIGNLTDLVYLCVMNNSLISLPKNIVNLTKLERLILSKNSLKDLPERIGDLINLKELRLGGNPINNIPLSIKNLTNLKELVLDEQLIEKLPANIKNMPSIQAYIDFGFEKQEYVDHEYKIILFGPAAVGKTNIFLRLLKKPFELDIKLTLGVNKSCTVIEYEPGKKAQIELWDIGGQERIDFIRSTFLKNAQGCAIVFDLSRKMTWDSIPIYINELDKYARSIPWVILGNKVDLQEECESKIDSQEIRDFAVKYNTEYFETSAKNNINIQEAFKCLIKKIN